MTKLMIDEKYAKELDKAEIDHHKPTAGAMLGHVLSNLFIENIRLTQAGIYAKSPVKCEYLREIAQKEVEYFFKNSSVVLGTISFSSRSKSEILKKYWTDENLLESFIVDFQAQNMFITRAIKLANKEEKFALAAGVVELYGYNLQVIRNLAGDLGKSVADFHDEDEDNDN
ncbi:hypothetical protein AAAV47_11265 [Staphylococcus hominis]